jgi:hypothetical protein
MRGSAHRAAPAAQLFADIEQLRVEKANFELAANSRAK